MLRFAPIMLFAILLTTLSGSNAFADLQLSFRDNVTTMANRVRFTVNGNDFASNPSDFNSFTATELPRRADATLAGLSPDVSKGIVVKCVSDLNSTWALRAIVVGQIATASGVSFPSSSLSIIAPFATSALGNSNTDTEFSASLKVKNRYLPLNSAAVLYESNSKDTDHRGNTTGTQISAEFKVDIPRNQPAGTYVGTVEFQVIQ